MGHAGVTAPCAVPPQPAAPAHPRAPGTRRQLSRLWPGAPPGHKRTRWGRLREVDQDSFIYIQTVMGHIGSRDRPPLLDRDDGSSLRSASAAPNALLEV